MKNCEKWMNRILTGDASSELEKHLTECPECRAYAALSRQVMNTAPVRMRVPAENDRAVLAYAASRCAPRPFRFAFFLRHAAMPAAACLLICLGLTFAFHRSKTPRLPFNTATFAGQYDMDNLDSDLLELSSRIQTASAALSKTAAYSAIYAQNKVN